MRRASWCLFAVLLAGNVYGQSLQRGLPFFTCTNARDFDAGNQSWHFMQDARGVIYVGNTFGVFEYDGASWRRIEGSGRNIVRSLDRDEKGRIFVGSSADFGYLRPDSIGVNRYVSLLEFVPEEDRAFNDIWTVHATPEGVYLLARERLFRLNEDGEGWSVRTWTPDVRFLYGFWFNGVYYLHQEGHGLSRLSGDTIVPIPGGQEFAVERAQVMLPVDDDPTEFLLGTFNRGLFRFDGAAFHPFQTEADAFFREETLYKAVVLRDGSYALTTLSGGVVILSRQGDVLQYLNSDVGFPTDNALAIFVDRSGVLWVAPRGAVCQVEVSSPLTRFDATLGLVADITDILRHDGVLYLTTQEGVQYLDETSRRLRPVSGFAGGVPQSWDLFSIDGELLVSHGTGIYRIIGDRAELVIPNVQFALAPTGFHPSALDKDRVFLGTFDGLALLRRDESGAWVVEASGIAGIRSQIQFLEEPEPGLLWITTGNAGIFRIRYGNGPVDDWVVDQFGPESGLVPGPTTVYSAGEKLIFADREGLLRFENGRFMPDSTFAPLTTDDRTIPFIDEDSRGNVWVSIGRETAVFRAGSSGELEIDRQAFQRFSGDPVTVIYPEEDGIVWFGTDQALIRYDPSVATSYESNFSALIRRVSSRAGRTVFGGDGEGAVNANIPYDENSLRFEYAGPTYENPAANEYQSFLEGFDEAWSDWTDEVRRDYTNLSPGNYTFHVRARNVYDHIGDEAAFAIAILPPWYRTLWAYGFYILLFGAAVFAVDRIQRRRLVKRERERVSVEQAELRLATAEAQTRALEAENEQKKNVELLSHIGRDITGTLSIEEIIETVYEHVNALMDAAVFGVGLYDEVEQVLVFPATKEKGVTLPRYENRLDDDSRLAAWCFKNRDEVVIQNLADEYQRYVSTFRPAIQGSDAASILYLPLIHREKPIGVITAQSFETNAYTEHHLNILRNLATYTAIALDNAAAYRRLNAIVDELNHALANLKNTQEQLLTQEKMASLGALTAGIAHEIKNPLNFVNNFSQLIVELTDELRGELESSRDKKVGAVIGDLDEIVMSLKTNARQIAKHGKRADDIVRSMMQHASGGGGERYDVGVNGFVEEYVQLAFHGMRARSSDFTVEVERDYDEAAGNVTMMPQDMGRVLINLLNNAFEALHMSSNGRHSPVVMVRTRRLVGHVEIQVIDNGPGIPIGIRERIFEPFFTTKPTGSGTGLGLSLSYEIVVKGHGGALSVESEDGHGTTFTVSLPA